MADENAPAPETPPSKTSWWKNALKTVLAVLVLVILFHVWIIGCVLIGFSSFHPGWEILCFTVLMLALDALCFEAIFRRRKRRLLGCVAAAAVMVAVIAGFRLHRYLTVDRYAALSDDIDWSDYDPFKENSRVVKVTPDSKYRIERDLPAIDCAFALYPIGAGVVQNLYNKMEYRESTERLLDANGSDTIYEKLLDRKVDLILALRPSRRQLEEAKKRGVTYEITPIGREAFVFFVHHRNPVKALTSEQIRRIYSGKITRWSETGAAGNSSVIKPFQRNEGSGSQTMLQRIMGDTPIMPPLREDRIGGMGGIINDVASYRNHEEALGFSFRFFASEMFKNGEIKLLAIDGVPPTRENIRNSTYPFIAEVCVVTVGERSENTRKVVEFLLSPAGQELIDKVGYVPIEGF